MRNAIILMAALTLSAMTACPAIAGRALPKRECLAFAPGGSCVSLIADPYGPNRYQAQQHYSCLSECGNSFEFCLMSYLRHPDPREYCDQAKTICLSKCP